MGTVAHKFGPPQNHQIDKKKNFGEDVAGQILCATVPVPALGQERTAHPVVGSVA